MKYNEISFLHCNLNDNIFDEIIKYPNCIVILNSYENETMPMIRKFFIDCLKYKIKNPIIIKRNYVKIKEDDFLLQASVDIGGLQIDGFGDGIMLNSPNGKSFMTETSFGILQASRTRISKTEYISCPSCGRTLFDLQETTAKIRKETSHLKGIKIGVMGCIVNGPGEMADADYGYVGTAPGKISLYKGQDVVKKHVKSEEAVEALVTLIKNNNDWIEP